MKHVNKIFRVHYYSMARHWLGDGQHSRYIYKYSSTQFSDQFGNFSYSYYIIFRRSETTDDLSVHLSALKHKIAQKAIAIHFTFWKMMAPLDSFQVISSTITETTILPFLVHFIFNDYLKRWLWQKRDSY